MAVTTASVLLSFLAAFLVGAVTTSTSEVSKLTTFSNAGVSRLTSTNLFSTAKILVPSPFFVYGLSIDSSALLDPVFSDVALCLSAPYENGFSPPIIQLNFSIKELIYNLSINM